jgi:hypothetical protein
MVHYCDDRVGVDLRWCSHDSATVKAPEPWHRQKTEFSKARHKTLVLTDARGVPIGVEELTKLDPSLSHSR